jgi:hypothetical protein
MENIVRLSSADLFFAWLGETFDDALRELARWTKMLTASNALETDLLELLFNGTALADLAENDSTTPATNLYVGLHTGDPGEAGNQTTNEATFTSYARVAVARTSGGWTISGNNVSNTAAVTFPQATGGSDTITYFSIGTGSSGTGYLMFSGALSASLAVSSGITPEFAIGDLDVNAD